MSIQLPPFITAGLLPRGDYPLTIDDLRLSHLVTGEGSQSEKWDSEWRAHLVDNLEILVLQLWDAGIDRIFVDGSFVQDKGHPSDIDGYFECDRRAFLSGEVARMLNSRDRFQIWDWNTRVSTSEKPTPQLRMWMMYHVELHPHYAGRFAGTDRYGNFLTFPAYFRKTTDTDQPKGIIQIVRN